MINVDIDNALAPLVAGRLFPDAADLGTPAPYITYQRVGGQDANTVDGPADLKNGRFQINVWAGTRNEADSLMDQVIDALAAEPLLGVPIGAPVSDYESSLDLRGSMLDFSIWHKP
ncbi:DUF3168 domain-containing protein [Cupriavidus basilensis]|uniref:DUF3168 domain-containing protein n=1 Tax=Cupriavidus basilensis TaxID=68895 RepID=UPI00157A3B5A|nr:DUF3168 domain-containing protein [Cupriavidus basilensis]NUA26107.1 DUF3168 domain-containing protein [Cupriavidus basilensis]